LILEDVQGTLGEIKVASPSEGY